jgi:hypothetical protein
MKPKCPNTECGADLQFVTRDYNYYEIDKMYPDGVLDVGDLDDSQTDEEYTPYFWCNDCGKEYVRNEAEDGFIPKPTAMDDVSPSPLRDHGYGDSPEVAGAPKITAEVAQMCPNCECGKLFAIEVRVKAPPMLRVPEGHVAVGKYAGCAACPWASPMVTSARPKETT